MLRRQQEGGKLVAHELAHVIQQSRGGAYAPPPLPSSGLENSAEQAAASVNRGERVQVTGASAPGLARQERWLSTQPNFRAMSDAELEREMGLVRQWLLDNPGNSSDSERLTEVLAMFEHETLERRCSAETQEWRWVAAVHLAATGARGVGQVGAAPLVGAGGNRSARAAWRMGGRRSDGYGNPRQELLEAAQLLLRSPVC
jgi:hypothetical protein